MLSDRIILCLGYWGRGSSAVVLVLIALPNNCAVNRSITIASSL